MKRIITTIVVIVVALIVVTLIVVGANLGRIVKDAINAYGPKMTQTSVTVDKVTLSILTGSAKVTSLVVGNPSGYKSPNAISLGTAAVGVDPMSLMSDKIVIRSIKLESPEVTFEGGLSGNNLSTILDNINATGKSGGTLSTNVAAQPKSEKKFEVDDLLITGAKANVILTDPVQRQVSVTLPDIHLTDLGKGGDGITATDLAQRTLSAITTATIEAAAKSAMNMDQNAATLKQAGQNAAKQQLNNLLNNKK
ncbi:MAG TPA: hypothetical protein VMH87_03625 [Pseudomonadales bacterium]|nr:hypothetical protein [Pseudomonadales bacterium]